MNSKKFSGMMPYGNYDWKDVFSQGFDLTTAGTELSILRDSAISIIKEFHNLRINKWIKLNLILIIKREINLKKPLVKSLSVITVNVPLKRPIVASLGTFEHWPYMLIEISLSDGTIGKGYIGPYLVNYTPTITLAMKELFKNFVMHELYWERERERETQGSSVDMSVAAC